MRRRAAAAGGLASVVLVAGGLVWVAGEDPSGGGDGTDASDASTATATAAVTRRDLEERAEVDGTLGYGDTTDVALGASADDGTGAPTDDGDEGSGAGTITALPDVGTVVDRGQTLVEVDGVPVPLLTGDRPLWRSLGAGVTDGADVAEVEMNLVALGVVTADELTVDEDWTAATTAAVEEWQEALGVEATGSIAPGDVVIRPAAVRVVDHPAAVGAAASGTVVTVTDTVRHVAVALEASKQTLVSVGQAVEVELPDGSTTAGTVSEVGTVATAEEDTDVAPGAEPAEATIDVTVTLDDPAAGGTFDEAPVTVRVVTSAATDVLAVPVDALLALAEGGYAVKVVDGAASDASDASDPSSGGTGEAAAGDGDPDGADPDGADADGSGGSGELVGVEVGAFADGWVEITGEVAEGDQVEVPA